jgi:protease I
MSDRLTGMKIAVLATDGFEQSELETPVAALKAEGATVEVVAPKTGDIQGWEHDEEKGRPVPVDRELAEANPASYDALVLPGGVRNPDKLRLDDRAIALIRAFVDAGKPIASICHGPWTLINAEGVAGKTMTSWPSLRVDLENAGATWVDREVVVDGELVTSRKPADLPAFCAKAIELFESERRAGKTGEDRPRPGRGATH